MDFVNIEQLTIDAVQGVESPFKALAIAKEYKKKVDECLKAIEEVAMEEAKNHPKEFESDGYEFTKRNGSRRFDFKHIEEWQQKKQELTNIEEKYKSAFQCFQRNLTSVSEDGEVLELPKMSQGKDSLIIKKKQ